MGHTHLRFYDPLHNRLHRSAAPSPWPRFFSLVALEPLPLPSLQAPAPRLTRPPTGRPPPPHPARFARPPGHPPRPPPHVSPGYFISPFKLIIKMLIPLTPPPATWRPPVPRRAFTWPIQIFLSHLHSR